MESVHDHLAAITVDKEPIASDDRGFLLAHMHHGLFQNVCSFWVFLFEELADLGLGLIVIFVEDANVSLIVEDIRCYTAVVFPVSEDFDGDVADRTLVSGDLFVPEVNDCPWMDWRPSTSFRGSL